MKSHRIEKKWQEHIKRYSEKKSKLSETRFSDVLSYYFFCFGLFISTINLFIYIFYSIYFFFIRSHSLNNIPIYIK